MTEVTGQTRWQSVKPLSSAHYAAFSALVTFTLICLGLASARLGI